PSEDHSARGDPLHGLVALIVGREPNGDDSAVGTRARAVDVRHRAFDADRVARPHGLHPTDFRSDADEAPGKRRGTFDKEPHRKRRGLPAARDEPAKEARFRGFRIDVEILRIVVARESYHLFESHDARLGAKGLADGEIFKIERHAFLWSSSGRSLLIAVISPAPAARLRARTSSKGSDATNICVALA